MPNPVSIVTVTYDSFFYIRLLVEKVRAYIGPRDYEIVVVDRGSRDGSREWLRKQPDVRLVSKRQWSARHTHGEAAEVGVRAAKYDIIVLLDSDAHPMDANWLSLTADRLDSHWRLAGAQFHSPRRDNPYGWYIHPHFMAFFKADLGHHIVLKKTRGRDTDTGEESTIRLLNAGLGVMGYPIEFCTRFSVGHPSFPTISAGVFHAWYSTRLAKSTAEVSRETGGVITRESYSEPLSRLMREAYQLDY